MPKGQYKLSDIQQPKGQYNISDIEPSSPEDVLTAALPAQPKDGSFLGQLKDRITSDAQAVADAPGVLGKLGTAADKAANAYKDVQAGAYKGAGSTAYNLTNLANKGIRFVANSEPGSTPEQVNKVIPEMPPQPNFLKPSNPIQSIGKGAEQAAEFFVPGGAVSKGEKAIDAVAQAAKIPNYLKAALKIGGGAALEGGANAGVAEAQGGDPTTAGLIGAGGKIVGGTLNFLAPALRKSAAKSYEAVLAPTTKENKFLANKVIPGLLDRNVIAGSRQGLEDVADANMARAGSDISTAVSNVPAAQTVKTQPVIDALEKYKQGFVVNGVPVNDAAVKNATDLQGTIKALGSDVSHQSMNRVRQILDESVAKAKGYSGATLSEGANVDVQKEAANAIRRELAKNRPDIAKLNAEYSFWSNVGKVIGDTNQRKIGQSGGLLKILAPAVYASGSPAHTGMTGAGGLEAAGGATMFYLAARAAQSPAWKSTSGVIKNQMANALATGNHKVVTDIASKVLASQASRRDGAQSAQP
jgi:hypothetical protein